MWMITIGGSFVLDHLNWLDLYKLLGFGEPFPILTISNKLAAKAFHPYVSAVLSFCHYVQCQSLFFCALMCVRKNIASSQNWRVRNMDLNYGAGPTEREQREKDIIRNFLEIEL